ETAQLDAVALGHCRGDLAEDCVDDVLDVALIQMRVLGGDVLNQFRLDHGRRPQLDEEGCQSANSPSRLSLSTVCTALHCSMRCASAFRPTASNAQAVTCRKDSSLNRGSSEISRTGVSAGTFFSRSSHFRAVFSSPRSSTSFSAI